MRPWSAALINDGFENDPLYGCFLCKGFQSNMSEYNSLRIFHAVEGVPVSCAMHTRLYSTWEGRMMYICGMFTKSTLSCELMNSCDA